MILVGYKPTTVTQRCLGQAAHPLLISKPPIIYVNHTCNLEGSNWRISGIKHLTCELTAGYPVYPSFPRLNFTWLSSIPLGISNQVRHGKHVALEWNDLPNLVEPLFTPITLSSWDDYGWKVLLGLLVLFLGVLAIVVVVILYKKGYIPKHSVVELLPTLEEVPRRAPSPVGDKPRSPPEDVAVSYWAKQLTLPNTPTPSMQTRPQCPNVY